jgi:hypothetical protein
LLRLSGLVDRRRKGEAEIYSPKRGKPETARAFLAKMK